MNARLPCVDNGASAVKARVKVARWVGTLQPGPYDAPFRITVLNRSMGASLPASS